MVIHAILHVPYEGLGFIDDWITANRLTLTESHLWESHGFPPTTAFDALIVMGGPMGVYEEAKHPWLRAEKKLIRESISEGKKVLGICLGAQLVADSLGARIKPNPVKEIGWFPVSKEFLLHSWFPQYDDHESQFMFHWHGDTFEIPKGAVHLFSSMACFQQGFHYDNHVLGLQFHPEVKEENIRDLIDHAFAELIPGKFIQDREALIQGFLHYGEQNREIIYDLLDYFILGDL